MTANAPIAKTLRPCHEESVDFDTTQNLFIEGDNLDALKLLQETYLGKVKMIYIDPPYNTGNDFIYEDDFAENTASYLQRSNQKDEAGNRLVANNESNGRFHSDWLSMMYPRLKLARNLLRDDGVIFISIDDGEVNNLCAVMNEVFGQDSFVAQFVWKSRKFTDARAVTNVSTDHEYILAYAKNSEFSVRGVERDESKFSNPDDDPRGLWMSRSILGLATKEQRPNLHYDVVDPKNGRIFSPNPSTGWRYSQDRMSKLIADGCILFPSKDDGRPREKKFRSAMRAEFIAFRSIIDSVHTADGTQEIRNIFSTDVFSFPKPHALIKSIVEQATDADDLVLDFFSGSATTAHAVMQLNAEDNGKRKFIMVQLPEACDLKSEAYKAGYKTIAEIGKERIRRAGEKLKSELRRVKSEIGEAKEGEDENFTLKSSPFTLQPLDVGFRVLKVDSSNMKDVYYTPDHTSQADLEQFTDNIKDDRSPEDLLFQVLLDWGVDISLPIGREEWNGEWRKVKKDGDENFTLPKNYTVFFVDGNALAACFDADIKEPFVKELAARHPLRVVFRDSGFASDSVKINIEQIFKLLSPSTEIKVI